MLEVFFAILYLLPLVISAVAVIALAAALTKRFKFFKALPGLTGGILITLFCLNILIIVWSCVIALGWTRQADF
ncbi:hypothetical protein KF913_14160 [Candidatus Obscuribacterales bacterium]|nr:hypothetical protein [Candidatus Obscuribacterales bacterium]